MKTGRFTFLLSSVLMLAAVGCGDGRPRCYPVSGTVQVDGALLTGDFDGTIRLVPVTETGRGRPATGFIGADGTFSLTTYEDGDGCPKGTYKVELSVLQTQGRKLFTLVPFRYEKALTSDIEVEITGKTEALAIEATWRPEDAPDRAAITGSDGAS